MEPEIKEFDNGRDARGEVINASTYVTLSLATCVVFAAPNDVLAHATPPAAELEPTPQTTEAIVLHGRFIATGAFDRKGRSWATVVYVHRDNPIAQLTLEQLDGVFGSERSGGYRGLKWMPQFARGPERNIRTWGELGLTGEWADKPIQTYGYAFTGMSNFFQLKVFNGGDKWNSNYRQYVEDGTKMVAEGAVGETGSIRYMLTRELARNKYGIAWSGIPHAADVPEVKVLALAAHEGAPYVMPTRQTVQDRTYPLSRSVFIYINRAPGKLLV